MEARGAWIRWLVVASLLGLVAVPVVARAREQREAAADAERALSSAETGYAMAKAGATGHYTPRSAVDVGVARVWATSSRRVANLWTGGAAACVAAAALALVVALVRRRQARRAFELAIGG